MSFVGLTVTAIVDGAVVVLAEVLPLLPAGLVVNGVGVGTPVLGVATGGFVDTGLGVDLPAGGDVGGVSSASSAWLDRRSKIATLSMSP